MSVIGRTDGVTVPAPALRFLVVAMDDRLLAFDAESVRGSVTSGGLDDTEAITIRGVTFEPVDLAGRLGLSPDKNGLESRVLLLSLGKLYGNVRVDRIRGLMGVSPAQVLPLPRQFQGAEQHWYRGMILFEDSVALVLTTAWVLQGLTDGQDEDSLEWQGGLPRLLAVGPELEMMVVPEC